METSVRMEAFFGSFVSSEETTGHDDEGNEDHESTDGNGYHSGTEPDLVVKVRTHPLVTS
jgi:hypothetical protein